MKRTGQLSFVQCRVVDRILLLARFECLTLMRS